MSMHGGASKPEGSVELQVIRGNKKGKSTWFSRLLGRLRRK